MSEIHVFYFFGFFFFFKQKTAYEMSIGDWSSDVCSSDLAPGRNEYSGIPFSGRCTAASAGDIRTISMQRLHPRSPYEKLGGYVHLPRLIDKARPHRKGLLDGYNYKTVGFDKHLLAFLKLNGDAFEEIANKLEHDGAILDWIQENGARH